MSSSIFSHGFYIFGPSLLRLAFFAFFIHFSISFYILDMSPLSALAAAIINSQFVI